MNPETENKKTLKEKNVKRLLGAALAVGAAGGLVRGIQLLSFDENGLPASAGGIHVAVWAILALEIAAAVAVWFVFGKRQICGRSGRSGLAEYLLPPAAAAVFALPLRQAFRLLLNLWESPLFPRGKSLSPSCPWAP